MHVDYKFGFVVTVPEDSGYDRRAFQERVIPHLYQIFGGNYFVPAFQKIILPSQAGYLEPTEKIFGVETNLVSEWWDKAYADRQGIMSTIEDFYGLGVAFASIGHENMITLVFEVEDKPRVRSGNGKI